MKTTTRRYLDGLHREAGWALRQCGHTQAQLSLALDVHESSVSRMCNGISWGTPEKFFELVDRLARHEETDPSPLIVRALTVIEDAMMDVPEELLEEMLDQALDDEAEHQAEGDVETYRLHRGIGHLPALEKALTEHTAALIRALAILRAMQRRRIGYPGRRS